MTAAASPASAVEWSWSDNSAAKPPSTAISISPSQNNAPSAADPPLMELQFLPPAPSSAAPAPAPAPAPPSSSCSSSSSSSSTSTSSSSSSSNSSSSNLALSSVPSATVLSPSSSSSWGVDPSRLQQLMMGSAMSHSTAFAVGVADTSAAFNLNGQGSFSSSAARDCGAVFFDPTINKPLPSGWERCLDLKSGEIYIKKCDASGSLNRWVASQSTQLAPTSTAAPQQLVTRDWNNAVNFNMRPPAAALPLNPNANEHSHSVPAADKTNSRSFWFQPLMPATQQQQEMMMMMMMAMSSRAPLSNSSSTTTTITKPLFEAPQMQREMDASERDVTNNLSLDLDLRLTNEKRSRVMGTSASSTMAYINRGLSNTSSTSFMTQMAAGSYGSSNISISSGSAFHRVVPAPSQVNTVQQWKWQHQQQLGINHGHNYNYRGSTSGQQYSSSGSDIQEMVRETTMVTAMCSQCSGYVLLKKSNPTCPRCSNPIILDTISSCASSSNGNGSTKKRSNLELSPDDLSLDLH